MNRTRLDVAAKAASVLALIGAACNSPDLGVGDLSAGGPGSGTSGKDDAGAGASSAGGATTASGLPCDVDAVLKSRCQVCHASTPKSGASTSLVTYEDLQKTAPGGAGKVLALVSERMADAARPMPPQGLVPEAERKVIDGWIASGAKRSSERCGGSAPDAVKPLRCEAPASITTLKGSAPYTTTSEAKTDTYVCVGIDRNLTKKRHVVGLAPKVDNAKILHHILVFQADQAQDSVPHECNALESSKWRLVTGWAPGGNNSELPPEAGFPEEAGTTHWVLQLHYNNPQFVAGQKDNSGFDICTTEELRPNDAGMMGLGSHLFNIPPRSTHTIKCDFKLTDDYGSITLFSASPHMHTRGTSMSTELVKGGHLGKAEMVFEQKSFNFENQIGYPISAKVAPGDVLRTRCTWKNPGDEAIRWGEGTGDEMCYDFISYYPANKGRTWTHPSLPFPLGGAVCLPD